MMRAFLYAMLLSACASAEVPIMPVQEADANCLPARDAARLVVEYYRETPLLFGSADAKAYLFTVQPDQAGAWSLFELRDGLACMIAHGVGWEVARPAGEPS